MLDKLLTLEVPYPVSEHLTQLIPFSHSSSCSTSWSFTLLRRLPVRISVSPCSYSRPQLPSWPSRLSRRRFTTGRSIQVLLVRHVSSTVSTEYLISRRFLTATSWKWLLAFPQLQLRHFYKGRGQRFYFLSFVCAHNVASNKNPSCMRGTTSKEMQVWFA